jgi:hypothetical protein
VFYLNAATLIQLIFGISLFFTTKIKITLVETKETIVKHRAGSQAKSILIINHLLCLFSLCNKKKNSQNE